jgi:hypothetical protein
MPENQEQAPDGLEALNAAFDARVKATEQELLIEQSQRSQEFLADKALPPKEEDEEEVEAETEPTEAAPTEDAPPAGTTATVDVPSGITRLVVNIQTAAANVVEAVEKALGRKDDEGTGFKVIGNYWWATWSNNFKDRDGEIFTAQALKDYEARVDMGVVAMPNLWVWHVGEQVDIGTAKMVGFDGHFIHAAGEFKTDPQALAAKAYYTKHAKDTGISHGFTYPLEKFDGKHYHQFNTFEISLLPRGTEANWYTSLEGVKDMTLDERKLSYLKEVFGEEHATRILADWDKRGKALEELNVEYKDFVAPADSTTAVDEKAVENADKAFRDFIPELVEGSGEAVTAALEAVKASKATNAVVAELRQEINALRAEMDLRPRSASKAQETEVEASHLSDALKESIKQQTTEKDPFWNTERNALS